MKKLTNIITIFLILFLLTFTANVYAATLNNLNITTDKTTVNSGDTVTLNIEFGQDLGAYTVNVDYDENLLEYISAEGGTANNTGTKVIVVYHYNAGVDPAPRNNMSITFKAKEGIITTNPTDLSITLTGLGTPDANPIDDITVPIVKNLVVEPVYVDYNIALNYTGDIIPNEEKEMEIVISSTMGKNYEHTRLLAEAITPTGENVKLLSTDSQNLEHDIIQSGWGSADGDAIGGKDVIKKIATRGVFSGKGDYTITLKLIDRENADAVIESKTFTIAVKEQNTGVVPPVNNDQLPPESSEQQPPSSSEKVPSTTENNKPEQTPNVLPKTGNTIYLSILSLIAILTIAYIALRNKKSN